MDLDNLKHIEIKVCKDYIDVFRLVDLSFIADIDYKLNVDFNQSVTYDEFKEINLVFDHYKNIYNKHKSFIKTEMMSGKDALIAILNGKTVYKGGVDYDKSPFMLKLEDSELIGSLDQFQSHFTSPTSIKNFLNHNGGWYILE